jgi:hypothetical protein
MIEDFTLESLMGAHMARLIESGSHSELDESLDLEEQPIVDDLYAAGYKLESVWNFVNTNRLYLGALPVLLKHVQLPYHERIKEGIVRALRVKEFRHTEASKIVLDEFKKLDNPLKTMADVINSIAYVYLDTIQCLADKSIRADLEAMAEDPKYALVKPDLEKAIRKAKRK